MDYANVPLSIGIVVSQKLATLYELDTIYGAEDLYNMLEIISVDSYNNRLAQESVK